MRQIGIAIMYVVMETQISEVVCSCVRSINIRQTKFHFISSLFYSQESNFVFTLLLLERLFCFYSLILMSSWFFKYRKYNPSSKLLGQVFLVNKKQNGQKFPPVWIIPRWESLNKNLWLEGRSGWCDLSFFFFFLFYVSPGFPYFFLAFFQFILLHILLFVLLNSPEMFSMLNAKGSTFAYSLTHIEQSLNICLYSC